MSFTTLNLTGTVTDGTKTPVAGAIVQLQLSGAITDLTTEIPPTTLSATADSNGTFSFASVVANDDTTTTPTGTHYNVTIFRGTEIIDYFGVIVPHTASSPVDLFSLTRVNSVSLPAITYGITTFNGRRGTITLTGADITGALPNVTTNDQIGSINANSIPPGNPLIYDDFSTYANGASPVTSLSGNSYYVTGVSAASYVVENGQLTLSPVTSSMTAYAQLFTGTYNTPTTPITRFGSVVTFIAGTTEGAAYGLNLWNGKTIPGYSCCHLTILTDHWTYGVWINGVFTIVYQKAFDNPLQFGVPMTFECVVDQPNGRGYVREPDGAIIPVSDPLIRQGLPGYYATWEETTVASTDWTAGISQIWADTASRPPAKSPQAEIIAATIAAGRAG